MAWALVSLYSRGLLGMRLCQPPEIAFGPQHAKQGSRQQSEVAMDTMA